MNKALLKAYDTQLRGAAEFSSGEPFERIGPLYAAKFPARKKGFITYKSIGEYQLDELISAAIAYFAEEDAIDRFEWKTRGHDQPAQLLDVLTARGFVLEEQETVMVGVIEGVIAASSGLPDGYLLKKATTAEDVIEAETVAGVVFGDSPENSAALGKELARRFEAQRLLPGPPSFEMWLVRDRAGEVVCSGRVEFVKGTDFAGVWGGACLKEHRGKGLYRALTAARAMSARQQGKRYLQSDSTKYSKPILERAGLNAITTTTPAIWHRS